MCAHIKDHFHGNFITLGRIKKHTWYIRFEQEHFYKKKRIKKYGTF